MNDYSQFENLEEGSPCPYCGKPLVIRHSQHGDFLGCSNYPDCSFLKPIAVSHAIVSLGEVGANCPRCGEPLLVKKGRFGIFIGCSDYPECTYVHNPQESLNIKCPSCKKGMLHQRSSKSCRVFYACSNSPDCTFSVTGKPVENICPDCSFTLMYQKKFKAGIGLVCPNAICESKKKRKHIIIKEKYL